MNSSFSRIREKNLAFLKRKQPVVKTKRKSKRPTKKISKRKRNQTSTSDAKMRALIKRLGLERLK